ncbi:hypothetical protein [Bacillus subtilis]|uniref:hypothetical protein n=1 Tax=Bacillus subtilis TaxID=1423 RepID=UPI00203E53E9|nr:hypothetical protein [Bacillus subtilis]MCM3060987.1 hypothetical protein [Bacillus subtilis]
MLTLQHIANQPVADFDSRVVALVFDLARCGINAKTIPAQAHADFEDTISAALIENSIREAVRRMARQHQ